MKFILERDGTYILIVDFDANINGETGEYEAKNSVIRLKPTDGEAYDLPISDVSETNMIIDLPLSNGCTAVITLKNTNC
ncbi:MAG: hypothetical protein ABJH98_16240 [Reichenbachiella sp.]|uniref:hypothetical protein n=1 Tax=Reichenbachiella sp. TaxID=2184521 RepID=UPI00329931B9